jgi:hypothetical protein
VRVIVLPSWLGRFLGASVAFGGILLAAQPPMPALLAHEAVHLARQEALGRWRWLWRYWTDRGFRLQEEAIAFAAEAPWNRPGQGTVSAFARDLASWRYGWAAPDFKAAMVALLRARG